MVTTDPLLGRLVDGRYEIVSRIARGGMATVYLATDRRLERDVAVKIMHPHLADGVDGASFVSRFRREARAAARLTHPGVVAVYDQGLDGETSYLTMEYVPGSNLRRELRRSGTLTVARTFDVLAQVLAALAAAHRKGLVHRDVKPENVLITTDGEHVKVADFGLARAVTEVTSTTTGTILGTVAYLAPEVIATGRCDARTDVYAVGVLAYEMLTGALPYPGETPIQVAFHHVHDDVPMPSARVSWLPTEVDELVAAFCARDAAQRPGDAGEALAALLRVRAGLDDDVLGRRAEPLGRLTLPANPGTPSSEPGAVGAVDGPSGPADSPGAPTDADDGDPDLDPDDRGNGLPAAGSVAESGSEHDGDERDGDEDNGDDDGDEEAGLDRIPAAVFQVITAPVDEGTGDEHTERLVEETTAPLPGDERAVRSGRRRRQAIAWVSALALLGGSGAAGTWWWFEDGPGAWARVPTGVVGVPLTEAREVLEAAGLGATPSTAHDDDVPVGQVVESDPAPGEQVRADGQVGLVVSLGVLMLTVPEDLVGAKEAEAASALRDAGFTVGTAWREHDDEEPRGTVMDVSVDEGSRQRHDTEVTLTVSDGPAPVTVPQQVGKEKQVAADDLESVGLKVKFAEPEHSRDVPKGHVLRQSPEDGAQAHRTDTVTLTLSAGPPIVDVPNVVGMRSAQAREALEAAGFVVDENKYLGGLLDTVRFQDVEGEAPEGSTITLTIW
jgi:serine/threonine protein kinase/beta-lactam-binding protein with PASTA domain